MKFDMKTPSIFVRTISILLVITFIAGQVSASQVLQNSSSDTLANSLVTDPDINPARSTTVQNDIVEKAEPGAIGNGTPLIELAQGKLPSSVDYSGESGRRYFALKEYLRKRIHLAISIVIANMHKVPALHMPRVKLALQDLIHLENQTSVGVHLFLADIRGREDYLLGFRTSRLRGLAADFIEWLDYKYAPDNMSLGARLIAQYVFHECVPEEGIITERDDHRVVYNEIQIPIFGEDEVLALKRDFREFIDEKAKIKKAAAAEVVPVLGDETSVDSDPIPYEHEQAAEVVPVLGDETLVESVLTQASPNAAVQPQAKEPSSNVVQPTTEQTPEIIMAQISKDLPVRAKIFAANLTRILAEHPDQLFFMGIETDIGESQKAQIMPIYKAIDEIRDMKDAGGKPLFPNLMVMRGEAEELVAMAKDLNRDGKLNLNNTFIGARKISVDSRIYDSIRGEGMAWISAIDDSGTGDYMPVFEAITLNMMAYLNADITAIKNFYDAISDKPIDPGVLQDMIRNRIIYILPRATKFDTKQLRELYELARQVYIAA